MVCQLTEGGTKDKPDILSSSMSVGSLGDKASRRNCIGPQEFSSLVRVCTTHKFLVCFSRAASLWVLTILTLQSHQQKDSRL